MTFACFDLDLSLILCWIYLLLDYLDCLDCFWILPFCLSLICSVCLTDCPPVYDP
ncbi:hypothetical protein LDENG_00150560 [Lucifuga dentata]|nr:hypothetical protein LDENG_00150560 [Lucifuga dentata]